MTQPKHSIDDLVTLMQRLREPETGCPWDLKQTYASITPSTLEEAYEVVDAIETGDFDHLKEELGDLLFQVIFYAQLGAEEARFDFATIASDLVAKLIRRHPHVFPAGTLESRVTDASARNEADIKVRWEQLKQQERVSKGKVRALADIPMNLAALSRAQKLQKRAANTGFDWLDINGPLAKVEEELAEVRAALVSGDIDEVAEEIGDLIFAAVNVSRHAKVDAESALRRGSQKFEQRFNYVEARLQEAGSSLELATLEQMDLLWDAAKQNEKRLTKE